jgi:hypothetical protein
LKDLQRQEEDGPYQARPKLQHAGHCNRRRQAEQHEHTVVVAATTAYIVPDAESHQGVCTLLGVGVGHRTSGTPLEGSYPVVVGTLVKDPLAQRVYAIWQEARGALLHVWVDGEHLSLLRLRTWRTAPAVSDLRRWKVNHHFLEEDRLFSKQKTRSN